MVQLKPLDEHVPIFHQLNADVSPVVLVNVFTVSESDIQHCSRRGRTTRTG